MRLMLIVADLPVIDQLAGQRSSMETIQHRLAQSWVSRQPFQLLTLLLKLLETADFLYSHHGIDLFHR